MNELEFLINTLHMYAQRLDNDISRVGFLDNVRRIKEYIAALEAKARQRDDMVDVLKYSARLNLVELSDDAPTTVELAKRLLRIAGEVGNE